MTRLIILFILFSLSSCAVPKYVPVDLSSLKTPAELAASSLRAYRESRQLPEKSERLKLAQAGLLYAEKCLKLSAEEVPCLYYHALNQGLFIKNHIPNYQKGLRRIVADCEAVIRLDERFEHGGCYRILGNIYEQAPSFALDPKSVTQDLDKSVEYLKKAVEIDPNYPLNQLFLARSLEAAGKKDSARGHLVQFIRLENPSLDQEYPEWKKDRDSLARKLLDNSQNEGNSQPIYKTTEDQYGGQRK